MAMHPMVKAYRSAMVKAGLGAYAKRLNSDELSQCLIFGYRRFYFRLYSVSCVPDWDAALIPKAANRIDDVVLIPDVNVGEWLPCDYAAKSEYEAFSNAIKNIVGKVK